MATGSLLLSIMSPTIDYELGDSVKLPVLFLSFAAESRSRPQLINVPSRTIGRTLSNIAFAKLIMAVLRTKK